MVSGTTSGKHCCGQTWNHCEIALAVIAVLLAVVVIILAIVLGTQAKQDDQPAQRAVLRNDVYTAQAGRIMSYMNASADPCSEFWSFACGGYVANTKPAEDGSYIDLFTVLSGNLLDQLNPYTSAPITDDDIDSVRKMKAFYQSCIDQDTIDSLGVQPIRDILMSLGGLPMIEPSWSDAGLDLGDLMVDLLRMSGASLSALQIYNEPTNNTINRVLISPIVIPLTVQLLSMDADNVAVIEQYKSLAKDLAKEIYGGTDAGRLTQIDDDVDEVIAFEKKLAMLVATVAQGLGPTTVANLTSQSWDWLNFLNTYIAPGGSTLTSDSVVIVYGWEYFEGLNAVVQGTTERGIVNYLLLSSLIRSWAPNSKVQELVSLAIQILSLPAMVPASSVTSSTAETLKTCTKTTNDVFGDVLSRFFVQDYTPPTVVQDVTMIGEYLKDSFKDIIMKSDWMDQATRDVALRKLENMPILVSFDPNILDDDWLNERYEERDIVNNTYFHNLISIIRSDYVRSVATVANPEPRISWVRSATIINAGNIKNKNTVEINGAFLQAYNYHIGYPKFLNFGSMGVFVGHELTHGFDNAGSGFNELGNLENWWTPTSLGAFDERTQCMVDQYSQYGLPEYGVQVDGQLTLAENIADNGGIKESFEAYQSWAAAQDEVEPSLPGFEHMSNEQMFFLSWGQLWCVKEGSQQSREGNYANVHAPNEWRAVGVLRNYAEFAAAYDCPSGSYMNPSKRCPVW